MPNVGDGWGMPLGEDLKLLSGDMKGWQLDCCFGINGIQITVGNTTVAWDDFPAG